MNRVLLILLPRNTLCQNAPEPLAWLCRQCREAAKNLAGDDLLLAAGEAEALAEGLPGRWIEHSSNGHLYDGGRFTERRWSALELPTEMACCSRCSTCYPAGATRCTECGWTPLDTPGPTPTPRDLEMFARLRWAAQLEAFDRAVATTGARGCVLVLSTPASDAEILRGCGRRSRR